MRPISNTPKRVLVTGATGYVGQPLCRALQVRGYAVYKFRGRLYPGGCAQSCGGMDAIIHCAAELHNRREMYRTNVIGTKGIVAAGAMTRVPQFLYISTASTRDTEYVRTKRKGEQVASSYSGQMRVVVVRLPTLYGGKRGPKWLQHLKLWLQGRPINLQSRDEAVQDILNAMESP